MKRDLDLIRKLLILMEKHEHGFAPTEITVDGYTQEQVGFHVFLLGDAGLAVVIDATHMGAESPSAVPQHLTWAGYEFLAAAKDETIWRLANEKVIKPTGGVAFTVLLEWLKAEAKARLGIP